MAAETANTAIELASAMQIGITVIGFIATIASLVLAIGAIWLSVVFYKMSNEASKETTKAAKDIQSSVERLEKIFDKLYSDTFSMMKDTVTDMRQHIWKKPHANGQNDLVDDEEKVNKLKNDISEEIIKLVDEKLNSNNGNNIKIKELDEKIKQVLESGIQKTIREQTIPTSISRRRALSVIRAHEKIRVESLLRKMNSIYREAYSFDDGVLMDILFGLRENGLITWDGPSGRISSDDILMYTGDREDNQRNGDVN